MWQTPKERKDELFRRLTVLLFFISLLLAIGTVVYHLTEGWSYLDSLYFSTISLATRGYSDLHPSTPLSILFSVGYLIIGAAVLIYGLSTMLAYYTSFYQPRIESKVSDLFKRITKQEKYDRWYTLKPKKQDIDPNSLRARFPPPKRAKIQ
jgi:voltage-gated potassium channel